MTPRRSKSRPMTAAISLRSLSSSGAIRSSANSFSSASTRANFPKATTSTIRAPANASASADSSRSKPTSARTSTRVTRATSRPSSASRTSPRATRSATKTIRFFSSRRPSPSRSFPWPSSRRPRSTRKRWASHCSASPRKTRLSASSPTRKPARRSSRAWASCTSKSSATA